MSKRSSLSRLEDLKRGFVDVGRFRYILHKIDMEPWRDKICPICNKGFVEDPRNKYENFDIHPGCVLTDAYDMWVQAHYEEKYAEE